MKTKAAPPPRNQGTPAEMIALAALLAAATLGCGVLGETLDELDRMFTAIAAGVSVLLGAVGVLGTFLCFLDARRGKAPITSIIASGILAIFGVGLALLFAGFRWPSSGGLSRRDALVLAASVGSVLNLIASVAARVYVHRITYFDAELEAAAAAADATERPAKIARAGAATGVFGGLYAAVVLAAITSGVAPSMPVGIKQIHFGRGVGWARFSSGDVAYWTRKKRATTLPAARGAIHLDVRSTWGCLVTAARDVACWSERTEDKDSVEPALAKVAGASDAESVAVTSKNACACLQSGAVVCWTLGTDHVESNSALPPPEGSKPGAALTDAVELVAGTKHLCARRKGGGVVCWGDNDAGQLGAGVEEGAKTAVLDARLDDPVKVAGLSDAAGLAAGAAHTCALRSGGDVVCWGDNQYGQLGDGTENPSNTPVRVVGVADAVEIVGGDWHTCARRRDGSVFCWGSNGAGQLGTTTPEAMKAGQKFDPQAERAPARADLPGAAAEIFASSFETCAVLTGGELYCWGANGSRLLRVDLRIQCGNPGLFDMPMCTPRPSRVSLDE